ncbi:hypothetical protein D3C72_2168480 [compost metagenome]
MGGTLSNALTALPGQRITGERQGNGGWCVTQRLPGSARRIEPQHPAKPSAWTAAQLKNFFIERENQPPAC